MAATDIILIIGAVASGIVIVIKAFGEFRALNEKVTRVDAKADVIAAVVAKVDGHVNSEKTAGQGRENTLMAENVILREMIADKKAAASLLAQAAAGASTTVVHSTNGAPVVPVATPATERPATEATLAEIESNTSRTEDTVNALKDQVKE